MYAYINLMKSKCILSYEHRNPSFRDEKSVWVK